jgi:2-hydroxy-3-keto-5-methylthiopentenyl-1-phosphate phosphatase
MIIQCDFDGTITTNNIGRLIRERFAIGDWERIEHDYLCGRLTVEQSNKFQFILVEVAKRRLQDFAIENATLRAGFKEFVAYCRNKDLPFVIVSSGLDLYIEAILASIKMLDLEYYCGRAFPGLHGYNVSYRDPSGSIIFEGFKLKFLRYFRQKDNEITFIGDGLSDLEAAKEADHIFATGHLHSLLHSGSVGHHPFSNFFEILNWVKEWSKNK